jgi:cytochrome c oxidase assembly protein subunit 15
MLTRARFATYAWGVTAWNVLTILWGAMVRATGAGAGCGSHWPLCNGQVVPRAPAAETLIEFSHRLTSGLALLLVIGLVVASRRVSAPGSLTRRASWASLGFVIAEALIGAGLVLFGWVAQDQSLGRALTVSLHLVNTLLLLGALTITARAASLPDQVALRWSQRGLAGIGAGLVAVAGLGATGAVTALGDTLFPALSLAEGLAADASPAAHALVRLRVVHPVLAVLAGGYLLALAGAFRPGGGQPERLARALTAIVLVQWAAGALNVILLAPVGLQIVHLLLADLTWITLVLLGLAIGEWEAVRPGGMASAHPGA